jgi:hypothetical protein
MAVAGCEPAGNRHVLAVASSNPSVATFAVSTPATSILGQSEALPQVAVTVPLGAAHGAVATAPVTFTATNVNGGDPPVQNPVQGSTAMATVLKPTRGLTALGAPFEATVFAVVAGYGAVAGVPNEFVGSSLGSFATANNDGARCRDALGHLGTLLNSATDLENYTVVGPLIDAMPASEAEYINVAAPAGTADLVSKP